MDGLAGPIALRPGSLILIAGPPGAGKTILLMQALAAWAGEGIPAAAFNYEHTAEEMDMRLLSAARALAAGPHGEADPAAVRAIAGRWQGLFRVRADRKLDTPSALVRRLLGWGFPQPGSALVGVDYLQLVPLYGPGVEADPFARARRTAEALKEMALRFGWTVAAIAAPDMGALQRWRMDGGTPEEDPEGLMALLPGPFEADMVIWLDRQPPAPCGCRRVGVWVVKDRAGPPRRLEAGLWGERFFLDWEGRHP
jgi:hypothetical protein